LIPLENIAPAFHWWRENVAVYRENWESNQEYKVRSRHFIKLEAYCAAKTRACLIHFSALNVQTALGMRMPPQPSRNDSSRY